MCLALMNVEMAILNSLQRSLIHHDWFSALQAVPYW